MILFLRKALSLFALMAMLGSIRSVAQKAEANQSLFRTPRSLSVESGLMAGSIIKAPPVQLLYFAPSAFLKSSYVLSHNWSVGASFFYHYVVINKLKPKEYFFPNGNLNGDLFARYFFLGRHSGIYVEAGPSFATTRLRKQLDTFDYGGIYPYFKMSLGGMMKINNGLYANINYCFALSLQKGYRYRSGLNIGLAYYFNRSYSELQKPYKQKPVREEGSPYYASLGLGFYPLPADDGYGEPYNLFMLNAKFGFNLNRTFSVGMLSLTNIGIARSEGGKVFPGMGPFIQGTFFSDKPYTFNVHTGILFSDFFLPEEGLPYRSFVTYVPIGLGFSKKLLQLDKDLSLDLSFALCTAVAGKKTPEGNISYYGVGLRYDFDLRN
jgi:hypothetical protein